MSSPSQGLHEYSDLPPNPYAAPDDVTIQQWQRKAEAVRANLTLPEHTAHPASTSDYEAQSRFPSQELSAYGVEKPHVRPLSWPSFDVSRRLIISFQAERACLLGDSPAGNLDEFLRLNAQVYAQHTEELEHPDGRIAFQTVQEPGPDNAQAMTRYPQGLLDGDHLLTTSVDDAGHDERLQSFVNSVVYSDAAVAFNTSQMDGGTAFDTHTVCLGTAALDVPCQLGSLPHEMVDDQTETAEMFTLTPSISARLEAAETLLLPSHGGDQAEMPESLDSNFDKTMSQHNLPDTEQCGIEHSIESETRSAVLLKDLRTTRPDNSASHAKFPSSWLADIHFPHPPSDGSESPLSMDRNSQSTFVSTIEHPVSAPDMSSILQSQAAAAAATVSHKFQEIQRIRQRKHGWFLRVGRVVAYICRLPTEQREKETMRFLACLGLSQPQQEAAFKIFVRMVEHNKETTKRAAPSVFRKWLNHCVLDAQKRVKAARNDAVDAETVAKGTFCSGGIHKLKCGHESRSNQDCGMNCITFSAYPDTPLINLRMVEIRCNECIAWP
jgi:hypothetical protein